MKAAALKQRRLFFQRCWCQSTAISEDLIEIQAQKTLDATHRSTAESFSSLTLTVYLWPITSRHKVFAARC